MAYNDHPVPSRVFCDLLESLNVILFDKTIDTT